MGVSPSTRWESSCQRQVLLQGKDRRRWKDSTSQGTLRSAGFYAKAWHRLRRDDVTSCLLDLIKSRAGNGHPCRHGDQAAGRGFRGDQTQECNGDDSDESACLRRRIPAKSGGSVKVAIVPEAKG